MTLTISAEDLRSIKAIEIAAASNRWLRCRTHDGGKLYGIPLLRVSPVGNYLVDQQCCDCPDAKRHPGLACKHQLAVRLVVELAKAQQPKARRQTPAEPAF